MSKSVKNSVGIVLVTHQRIGAQLVLAAEFILGLKLNLQSLSINQVKNIVFAKAKIKKAIKKADTGAGVLLITDIVGATPFNLCQSLVESKKVAVISGVNLPLLLKAISIRADFSLTELTRFLKKYSLKTIH